MSSRIDSSTMLPAMLVPQEPESGGAYRSPAFTSSPLGVGAGTWATGPAWSSVTGSNNCSALHPGNIFSSTRQWSGYGSPFTSPLVHRCNCARLGPAPINEASTCLAALSYSAHQKSGMHYTRCRDVTSLLGTLKG